MEAYIYQTLLQMGLIDSGILFVTTKAKSGKIYQDCNKSYRGPSLPGKNYPHVVRWVTICQHQP